MRILTSSQDFPWARRGYKGALGLAKDMKFETATSLGCRAQTDDCRLAYDRIINQIQRKQAIIVLHCFCKPYWSEENIEML